MRFTHRWPRLGRMKAMAFGRGHTLVETLVVTTIVGGLGAVAVPRVADWATEARVSVVRSMEGAVHTASRLMHMGCAVRTGCPLQSGETSINVSGSQVELLRGYPAGGDAMGIANAIEYKGFDTVQLADASAFRQQGAPHPERCAVIYQSPQSDGMPPRITSEVSGC